MIECDKHVISDIMIFAGNFERNRVKKRRWGSKCTPMGKFAVTSA
jgi:hypothetical protein